MVDLDEELPPNAPEPDPEAWDEEIKLEESPESKVRALRWLELGVVLCLGFIAPLASGILAPGLLYGDASELYGADGGSIIKDDLLAFEDLFHLMVLGLQVLAPLLWIVWRSDLKWSEIGIVKVRWGRDLGIGVALTLLILGMDFSLIALMGIQFLDVLVVPVHPFMIAFMAFVMIVNSLYEEILWRGYVLTRLRQLLGSAIPAVVIGSVLFGSYHIYQGAGGAMLATLTGAIWCLSVLWLRSVWPAVVSHTLVNVYVHLHFAWFPSP